MNWQFWVLLFALGIVANGAEDGDGEKEVSETEDQDQDEFANSTSRSFKKGAAKALSVFQVVRFPNTACSGSSSLNGTCYTASECANKGGTSSGSCANSFGVCCTFTLGCGSTTAENTTFFQSSTSPGAGQCGVTVCKCNTDICQLRIDFNTFVIAGPNTVTLSNFKVVAGSISTTAGMAGSQATQCQTDTFTVTGNGGGTTPPVICGTNTGAHMYVDASNMCNQLNFQLGVNGIGTTIPSTRSWNLQISQISCLDPNLPPQSCTQYFYGTSGTGTVNTFNYVNSIQLANQLQTICIRRERGMCKICYSPPTTTDFSISGLTTKTKGIMGMGCCNWGSSGTAAIAKGFDCLRIPGARKVTATVAANPLAAGSNFCGNKLATTVAGGAGQHTICSRQQPFMLQFESDAFSLGAAIAAQKGFKLIYWETTTC
jgi:hypothetical protein